MTTEFKEALILEQYRILSSESLTRIKEYHKLWFYKLISCGAILSFIMTTNTPETKFGSILVPFLATVFDALITNNLILINALGSFISKFYEQKYKIDGWDTISTKTKYFGVKKTWLTDWLIISLSTMGLFLLSIFLLWKMNTVNLNTLILIVIAFIVVVGHIYITFLKLVKNENKPNNKNKTKDNSD